MQTRVLTALATIVLIAGGIALVLLGGSYDAAPSASAPGAVAEESNAPSPAVSLSPPATTEGPGERESVIDLPAPLEPVAAAAPETFQAAFTGRFLDAFGDSLEGVEVTASLGEGRAASLSDGRFQLELELPPEQRERTLPLLATLSGYESRRLEPVAQPAGIFDLGDIVLGRGGVVLCTVVDGDGLPVPSARVLITAVLATFSLPRSTPPPDPFVEGITDEAGQCRLEGVPEGDVRVWAGGEGTLWAFREVRVVASRQIEVELLLARLDREDAIELVVLAPGGEPVPFARIQYHYHREGTSGSGGGAADGQGRYRHQLHMRVPHDFTGADPNDRYRPALARQVPPGARGRVLQLEEQRGLALHVSDLGGAPVLSFSARTEMISGEQRLPVQRLDAVPEDEGVLQLLLPTGSFDLEVQADGYQTERLGPFDPSRIGARLELRLTPLPGVRGRVVDEAGGPVAGAELGLHRALRDGYDLTVNGFPCRSDRGAASNATSDDDGRFELTLRESGRFYLRAEARGFAPAESGPLELEAQVGARELVLVLGQGGGLEGSVLMPPGESPAGVIVGISRGDGHGETQRTDAKGSYRFERLTPGRWLVERRSEELSRNRTSSSSSNADEPQSIPWSCEVWPGRTTHFDLDLRGKDRTIVEGHLFFSGAPCSGWQVSLLSRTGPTLDQDVLDSQGHFRMAVDDAGEYTLQFFGSWEEPPFLFLRQELEPWDGVLRWEHDLPVGRVEGRIAASLIGAETRLTLRWSGPEGIEVTSHFAPQANGTFLLRGVPAGAAALSLSGSAEESSTKELSVPAGGSVRVGFP